MQGYVPAGTRHLRSRESVRELEDWMASEEAAGLQHGELEEQLDVRGRELLRQLFQDRLDATAAVRSGGMTWPGKTAWCARARKKAGNGRW